MKVLLCLTILFFCLRAQFAEPKVLNGEFDDFNNISKVTQRNYVPSLLTEVPKTFISSYNSFNPVLVLVEQDNKVFNNAKTFMKNVYKIDSSVEWINFLLMTFNETDTSGILAESRKDKTTFDKKLETRRFAETRKYLGLDSDKTNKQKAGFYALLNAVNVLPANSGILLFIGRGTNDESLAQLALSEAKTKNIRVYVIWGGNPTSEVSDARILKEFATNSGGLFLNYAVKNISNHFYNKYLTENARFEDISMVLSQKKLRGDTTLHIPIDLNVVGIAIHIEPSVANAHLTTPRGFTINVLNEEDVNTYGYGSFLMQNQQRESVEVYLNTSAIKSTDRGSWTLHLKAENEYNVSVFLHTNLGVNAVLSSKKMTGVTTNNNKNMLKINILGNVSSIENVALVNSEGQPIQSNVKFNPKDALKFNKRDAANREIDVEVDPKLAHESVYAAVTGKDTNGNTFRRLSYIRQNDNTNGNYFLPPMTVEIGQGSELLTTGNKVINIYFEVTNNLNKVVFARFTCRDDQSFLLNMDYYSKWLTPQEKVTVKVALAPRAGATRDKVVFLASGCDTATKEALVDIDAISDRYEPELHYSFSADCTNVLFGRCQDGVWTLKVTARDSDSGLLQIETNPRGLRFPNGFTSGTTEEVTGFVSGSCCDYNIQVTATDRSNNRRTYTANAYRNVSSPGAIAAIVLGCILIIIIIIAIVLWVRSCRSNRIESGSFDLPNYRGPTSTSRRY